LGKEYIDKPMIPKYAYELTAANSYCVKIFVAQKIPNK
jgi:hypothetical protein